MLLIFNAELFYLEKLSITNFTDCVISTRYFPTFDPIDNQVYIESFLAMLRSASPGESIHRQNRHQNQLTCSIG